jgi:hypothetical protein
VVEQVQLQVVTVLTQQEVVVICKEEMLFRPLALLLVLVVVDIMVVVVQLVAIAVRDKAVADHLGRGHLLVRHFKAEFAQEMDKSLLVGSSFIKLNSFYLNSIKY